MCIFILRSQNKNVHVHIIYYLGPMEFPIKLSMVHCENLGATCYYFKKIYISFSEDQFWIYSKQCRFFLWDAKLFQWVLGCKGIETFGLSYVAVHACL